MLLQVLDEILADRGLCRALPKLSDPDVVARAKRRGNELWAEELIDEESVETIDGPLNLEEIIDSVTVPVADAFLEYIDFEDGELSEPQWEAAMQHVREQSILSPSDLQQLWWLYPIYQDDPVTLKQLLTAAREKQRGIDQFDTDDSGTNSSGVSSSESSSSTDSDSSGPVTTGSESGAKYTTGGTLRSGDDTDDGGTTTESASESKNAEPRSEYDLPKQDLQRLHDLAATQPTKNVELCSLWGYGSGSELYSYLRESLIEYFERNENGLIVLNDVGEAIVSETSPPR